MITSILEFSSSLNIDSICRKIAKEVLQNVQEYEIVNNEMHCTGSCFEIAEECCLLLAYYPIDFDLYVVTDNIYNYEHCAVKLPKLGLIFDTQAWQFTEERRKNRSYIKIDPIEKRKILFTEKEYSNLGFIEVKR